MTRRIRSIAIAWGVGLVVLVPTAAAADIVVTPGQSIQAAILLAANGDRILIQPGTYFQHSIDLKGKALQLIGVGGAAVTILDGGNAAAPNLICHAETEVPIRVEGLTLRNCLVGIRAFVPGVLTVSGCVLEDHHYLGMQGSSFEAGHGIYIQGVGLSSVIVDSVIRNNEGSGVRGPIDVTRCLITGNQDTGVYFPRALRECRITNNHGVNGGGVILSQNYALTTESQTIDRCEISSNHAVNGGGVWGGAQFGMMIKNCRIVGNSASNQGGGVYFNVDNNLEFWSAFALVRDCVIAGNSAGQGGGAYLAVFGNTIPTSGTATIERCTVSGNTPDGLRLWCIKRVIKNSIFWNQPNALPITTNATVTYTDFQGGFPGVGNVDVDPQFVDAASGDYHLRSTSPLIDAGTGTVELDFEGDVVSGPIDIGADQIAPHLSLTGDTSPGGNVRLGIYGAPGATPVLLFLSGTRLETGFPLAFGVFGLGFPWLPGFPIDLGPMQSGGAIIISTSLPPSAPVGVSFHMQAFLGAPAWRFTNVESFQIG